MRINLQGYSECALCRAGLQGGMGSWGMDLEVLEKEIEADQRAGRLPCAVLATFGGDITKCMELVF